MAMNWVKCLLRSPFFKDNMVQNQKMVKAEEKARMASEVQVNKRNQLTYEFDKGVA